ncbi:OmpW family protein [Phreatobacter aquaticus]|uniref:OmpW family protein n=1 Tax=Phreatobacter aquaticus TaxID=2570229 RepID=A0A4D7QQS4_9HYPH|nr:OmpW family protein [Phreatobacter aquaticus]QCK87956.1 OmpW family protein [Phreatobacter aquaticus]
MKTIIRSAALGAALSVSAFAAQAADLGAPRMPIAETISTDFNPWQIRLRALAVIPSAGGAVTQLNGAAIAPLGGLGISNSIVPELDITYYFTKNIAVELILGVTPHNVRPTGALAGALASTATIGKTWLLPPTLMLQYHFTNFGAFKPYVGAGLNYTMFFSQSSAGAMAPGGGGFAYNRFSVAPAAGLALQVGFDYMIDRHWGVNLDVKKIFLRSNFKYTDTTGVLATTSGRVTIDPWLISTGITYRF